MGDLLGALHTNTNPVGLQPAHLWAFPLPFLQLIWDRYDLSPTA